MLTRLTPEQISKFWDVIKYALDDSPPLTVDVNYEDWINRILASALSGSIEVWASYTKKDSLKFEGVMLTSFVADTFLNVKNLLIYYIYSYNKVAENSWTEGIKAVAKYAYSRGCLSIVAYTDNEDVIEIVNKLGGDTKITFITFNVKDLI